MNTASAVLIIDTDQGMLDAVAQILLKEGYQVTKAHNWKEALPCLSARHFSVVMVDVRLPDIAMRHSLPLIQNLQPTAAILTTAELSAIDLAIESLTLGAYEYLGKPFDHAHFLFLLRTLVRKGKEQLTEKHWIDRLRAVVLSLNDTDAPEMTSPTTAMRRQTGLCPEDIHRLREALMSSENGIRSGHDEG